MPRKLKYIFIDESGTLPDKNELKRKFLSEIKNLAEPM